MSIVHSNVYFSSTFKILDDATFMAHFSSGHHTSLIARILNINIPHDLALKLSA